MTSSTANQTTTAQRANFVDDATSRALNTLDNPRTPEGVERAVSAAHREGRVELSGNNALILWNFDIGSAAMKSEHEQALAKFLRNDAMATALAGREIQLATRFKLTGRA